MRLKFLPVEIPARLKFTTTFIANFLAQEFISRHTRKSQNAISSKSNFQLSTLNNEFSNFLFSDVKNAATRLAQHLWWIS